MGKYNWRKLLFKPFGILVVILRHITSWYIAPIWAFCFPYFVGDESFLLSAAMALVVGFGSYKLWSDYEPELDGQITIDELKNPVKDDLSE